MKFNKTLSGRIEEGYECENNDCAVRAWAEVLGITYAESHSFWKTLGRQDGKGTYVARWLDPLVRQEYRLFWNHKVTKTELPYYKWHFPDLKPKRKNIKTFIQENPTGKFMIMSNGHAKAIIDGVICDADKGEYCEIISYYKFELQKWI